MVSVARFLEETLGGYPILLLCTSAAGPITFWTPFDPTCELAVAKELTLSSLLVDTASGGCTVAFTGLADNLSF